MWILLIDLASLIISDLLGEDDSLALLNGWVWAILTMLLGAYVVYLLIRSVHRAVARLRSRSSRARVDQQIVDLAAENETDSKRLASKVMKTASASGSLVERRVQRYLVEASQARHEAEAELLRNPPDLPRTAKRMVNQLRVLLAVAINRGMLDDNTGMTAAHLGRWIVLQSKWPDLGHALTANPDPLQELQGSTTPDGLHKLLASMAVEVKDPEELLRFLHTEPPLWPVLKSLVRYIPASVN